MKYIAIILIFNFSLTGWSQKTSDFQEDKYKKNSIHLSAGTWFLYGEYNFNYEHIFLKESYDKFKLFLGGQFGIGVSESFSDGTHFTPTARLFALTGEKNSHLELNGGLSFNLLKMNGDIPTSHIFSQYSPVISVGYRFQNLTKRRLVFRTGFGWPMGFYVGMGWSF